MNKFLDFVDTPTRIDLKKYYRFFINLNLNLKFDGIYFLYLKLIDWFARRSEKDSSAAKLRPRSNSQNSPKFKSFNRNFLETYFNRI